MTKIFLSHNSGDKAFVKKLARDLQKAGVQSWVDEAEIKVGDSLITKIQQGIKSSEFVAAVLSPNSITSEWVKRELEIALNNEIAERKVIVLPLLIADCEIPAFLRGKLYADFRTNYKNGMANLLKRLLPKRSFDAGKLATTPPNGKLSALVSFKNEDDRPVLRKRVSLDTTVGAIRKSNPIKGGHLWIDVLFDDIPRLERVELFCFERTRGLRLTFDMNLQDLVPSENDEASWRRMARHVEDAIWKYDSRFMKTLETDDIAVNWGGPDAPYASGTLEILYYIDNSFGYMLVQRNVLSRSELDGETLSRIRNCANKISTIVKEIVSSGRIVMKG